MVCDDFILRARCHSYVYIILCVLSVFSGLQVAPEYKPHPLFLCKIWEKFIGKSHLSISGTLFCYFLARRNVLGCIHVMRRSAKERQDAIDVIQKTLHAGLIACESLRWCSNLMPSQDIGSVPHEVGQLCDVWVKVWRDALSLLKVICNGFSQNWSKSSF